MLGGEGRKALSTLERQEVKSLGGQLGVGIGGKKEWGFPGVLTVLTRLGLAQGLLASVLLAADLALCGSE